MPITVPDDLPAVKTLEKENIFVIYKNQALKQDIRPLKILILNLMPTKIVTETQILRCLSNTPLQIEVDLLQTESYTSKNTPKEHLFSFYNTFEDIKHNKYDGLIVTGAPVETMQFNNILYIDELNKILKWAEKNVYSSLFICFGAQAALKYYYNIDKYIAKKKIFGVFSHTTLKKFENIFRGFDDEFFIPHSRNAYNKTEEILKNPDIDILASSKEAGPAILASKNRRKFFILGHFEYDKDTLAKEYYRDLEKGEYTQMPKNYFCNDDPKQGVNVLWRAHAQLFFSNWLNYFVYQQTPFDINSIN